MPRRALLIGIDEYTIGSPLNGCVDDANRLAAVIARNSDNENDPTANFECRVLLGAHPGGVTRSDLGLAVEATFAAFDGDILFYFSGHGATDAVESYLVTTDGTKGSLGYPMNKLFKLAGKARQTGATSVTIILDCCHAGGAGNAPDYNQLISTANLPEGVTLLAASRPDQEAMLINGRSAFTDLLIQALDGGAADIRGIVTAGSAYAYVESSFSAFDQRPVYKSHAQRPTILRRCKPKVTAKELMRLAELFPQHDEKLRLSDKIEDYRLTDPTNKKGNQTEATEQKECDDKDKQFRKLLKTYQIAGLIKPIDREDLFWACLYGESAVLTPKGKYYWHLIKKHII